MRIWSLHPEYLDAKGLTALWREALLARKVLEGKTAGYKHHPQLMRFITAPDPVGAINRYLHEVYAEALRRSYRFDAEKLVTNRGKLTIPVTRGQLKFEAGHLLRKLRTRDKERYLALKKLTTFRPHPVFRVITGGIESWEKI
ncbi:MAG TPA: pyrimidine dimer DNA glycosylase/endonuclease V [Bacteroidales bacterium]|nr:pyrimidine dimer DNA glycosylase/endonuclease V [Bacteroidales bacterium]